MEDPGSGGVMISNAMKMIVLLLLLDPTCINIYF